MVGCEKETLEMAYIVTIPVTTSGAATVPAGPPPLRGVSEPTGILDNATNSLISHTKTHPSGTLPPTPHNHGVVTPRVAGDMKWLSPPPTAVGATNVRPNSPSATAPYSGAVGAVTVIAIV